MSVSVDLDKEIVLGMVVEEISKKIINSSSFISDLEYKIKEKAIEIIKEAVENKCASLLRPVIENSIENIIIKNTNLYGEKKGEEKTLTEYIIDVSGKYLQENVDNDGKTRERDSYYKNLTRLEFLIDKKLKESIRADCIEAMKSINDMIMPKVTQIIEFECKSIISRIQK